MIKNTQTSSTAGNTLLFIEKYLFKCRALITLTKKKTFQQYLMENVKSCEQTDVIHALQNTFNLDYKMYHIIQNKLHIHGHYRFFGFIAE